MCGLAYNNLIEKKAHHLYRHLFSIRTCAVGWGSLTEIVSFMYLHLFLTKKAYAY